MRKIACPTNSALRSVDKLIAKLRLLQPTPELNEMVRLLSAARVAGECRVPPARRRPSSLADHIADAREDIVALSRWPNGPKMKEARHRLKLNLLLVVRPLIEGGYGTPARPLVPALARAAGMTQDDARVVVNNMLKSRCLNYPLGARGPMLDEGSC